MSDYLELTQNIEWIQAKRRLSYIEAQNKLRPEYKSRSNKFGGGTALYAGPGSPVNRVMGLGLGSIVSTSDIEAIENFYNELNEPVKIDLCPISDRSLLNALNQRNYTIEQIDEVLYLKLPLEGTDFQHRNFNIEQMDDNNRESWIEIIAESFSENNSEYPVNRGITEPSAFSDDFTGFLACIDGRTAGAGGIYISGGMAEIAPDGTLPQFRGKGIQTSLISYRLQYAQRTGCKLVVVSCAPGVSTRSNAEKLGFKLVYTKIVMTKTRQNT